MNINLPDDIGVGLPDNNVGNTLSAQQHLAAAVDAVAAALGTDEADLQATRVKRFLGFVPKRARTTPAKPVAEPGK